MDTLAQKIIELRLATRRACMCEGKGQSKKNTLSLKTKVMFLISKGCCPKEIIQSLVIAKTNLALLTKDMAEDGLIVKTKGTLDRREVSYTLTEKGRAYLDERMSVIEEGAKSTLLTDDDYNGAIELIERATRLLSGIE